MQIPPRIDDFSSALYKIFGVGAGYLEILVMKNLNKNLNRVQQTKIQTQASAELTFTEYVKMKKQQFDKPSEISSSKLS
ncbi:MAG: hypothetical protein NWF05_05685 [Candidatus Bathyarchaeota archaeon]|nr:hypothetical protein [Candidatus Bathyarchaeota archaeon]